MAAQGGEDVYASLLLTDDYLPGALVLAHSLRDAGTTKKLAILVTLDTVSAEVITQLQAVYDYVIPVPRIQNEKPANLFLMNRPDLHSAFTKINLWKQTQFRKIVYLDADVVAYRAVDELFALPHSFSAAPDIGWPDLFNTGVMVLTPSLGEYYALMAMAERGISFDGADQGLLNMHFKNTYNRLNFTYNVTPSAHYQYVPAYRHFQSGINLVHFIGSEKPWALGRDRSTGSSPFDEIAGRWWAVYDRHYRKEVTSAQPQQQPAPEIVQYFVKGEYQPRTSYVVPVGEPSHKQPSTSHGQQYREPSRTFLPSQLHFQTQDQHHQHFDLQHDISHDPPAHQRSEYYAFTPQAHHHHHSHHDQRHDQHPGQQHDPNTVQQYEPPRPHQHQHQHHHHHGHSHPGSSVESHQGVPEQQHHHEESRPGSSVQISTHPNPPPSESFRNAFSSQEGQNTEARKEQEPYHQERASHPSPPQPKPEPVVTISWDAQRQPPPPESRPEAMNFPQIQYEMSSDPAPFVPPERYPSPPRNMWYEVPKEAPAPPREKPKPIFPWENNQTRVTRVFAHEEAPEARSPPISVPEDNQSTAPQRQTEPSVTESSKSEPQTPTAPIPWSAFPRTNAWDDVPEITRYVDAMQKHRRTRSQGLRLGGVQQAGSSGEQSWGHSGLRVTDFPSAEDRPSLPVTPAPTRRPRFWGIGGPGTGSEEEEDEKLPAAEGVPAQSEWVCVHGIWWTPADCLCDLANVLRDYKDPMAQLQKLAKQHSDVLLQKLAGSAQSGDSVIGTKGEELPSRPLPYGSEDAKSPTYVARSPGVISPTPVKPATGTHSERHILAVDNAGELADTHIAGPSSVIAEPSYQGPGMAFEKGEDIPTHETPALPTEAELDVLQT